MERDPVLEAISDRIRHGEPVSFREAIDAIEYQGAIRRHAAENTWWKRLKHALTAALRPFTEEGNGNG